MIFLNFLKLFNFYRKSFKKLFFRKFDYEISKTSVNDSNIAGYLRTECGAKDICAGTLFPGKSLNGWAIAEDGHFWNILGQWVVLGQILSKNRFGFSGSVNLCTVILK